MPFLFPGTIIPDFHQFHSVQVFFIMCHERISDEYIFKIIKSQTVLNERRRKYAQNENLLVITNANENVHFSF